MTRKLLESGVLLPVVSITLLVLAVLSLVAELTFLLLTIRIRNKM
jgi:hypothetical protein